MNKLGFAINYASQGLVTALVCNKGQWTNKVVDIREYLKLFSGLANIVQGSQISTGRFAAFMSFDDNGCFLTQMKAIDGRIGDFLAGWIYIPNSIEATGEEIINTYDYVRTILSQSNLTDLKTDIDSFFSKEYPIKEFPIQCKPSGTQLFGVRYLGHYTLKEIVGEDRYQPYYSNYKAVFLIDKNSGVMVSKDYFNNFQDLTNEEIIKTAVLIPPASSLLNQYGRDIKLTLEGKIFSSPQFVYVGVRVPLTLCREGFENIKFEVQVTSKRQAIDLSEVKIIWKKKLSASMFTVRNSKHEKIDKSVRISVNGVDISYQTVLLAEEDCKCAVVKVTAPDYEAYEQKRNLLTGPCEITLNRKIKSLHTYIELTDGNISEMTIESKYLPSGSDSPLKGYDYDDYNGGRILKLSSWFVWKQRLLGFGVALISVCLLSAAWLACSSLPGMFKKVRLVFHAETTEPISMEEEPVPVPTNKESFSDPDDAKEQDKQNAITYLTQQKWYKDSLEHYKVTKGLFDALNTYDFNAIKAYADSLPECSELQYIKNAILNNKESFTGKEYNNDPVITIKNYIEKIARPSKQTTSEVNPSPLKAGENSRPILER